MAPNDPKTPLAAAVEAAQEFKNLLDIQPVDKLFWPKRLGGNLFRSSTYHRATALLDQAASQNLKSTEGPCFERRYVLPMVDVIADDRTGVPADQLKLFANITAGVAQLVVQIMEERSGRGEHGGFLEIGIRSCSKIDVPRKQIEGERDAIHNSAPVKFAEQGCATAILGQEASR